MSVHHSFNGDILTLVINGGFSPRNLSNALNSAVTAAAFEAPMRLLIDARSAGDESSAQPAVNHDSYRVKIRDCFIPHWAIVAHNDTVLFHVARMVCALSDLRGVDMRAYRSIDEARSRLTWNTYVQQVSFCSTSVENCRPQFIGRDKNV